MLTEDHNTKATKIVAMLAATSNVDERTVHLLGGVVYEVIDILKEHKIISQFRSGRPYARGVNFHRYISLDNLIHPPKDKWESLYKKAAIFSAITVPILMVVAVYQQAADQQREKRLDKALKTLDTVTEKVLYLDSLRLSNQINVSRIDSLVID